MPTGRSATAPSRLPRTSDPSNAHDVTRYLCAAAQTDAHFNSKLINCIVNDERRAIASSPGVDLPTVLRYGLAARARQLALDTTLAILGVVELASIYVDLTSHEEPIERYTDSWVTTIATFVLAWLVIYAERVWTYCRVLAPELRLDVFDPAKAPEPGNVRIVKRLAEVGNHSRGNVSVFADFQPFIGYGEAVKTWSLSLNVAAAEEGSEAKPFEVHELYDAMAAATRQIGLPGAVVEDRLFVSGHDLLRHISPASVRRLLLPAEAGAPAASVGDDVIHQLRNDPHTRARPYLAICVPGWGGELAMTLFLRFTLAPQRDLLFIEASHSLLTPVLQRYRAVDGLRGRPTARQLLKAAPGIFSTLGATTACIPRLLFTAYSLLTRHWQNRNELRAIRDDRVFNYGPRISPREAASDQQCHRYFQELDSEMYEGLVQRRVLDTLTDFLTEHNVDVGDLKEQRTTILNHGIYVTGQGSLSAKNVAAGASALSLSLDMLKRNKSPQKSSRGASS